MRAKLISRVAAVAVAGATAVFSLPAMAEMLTAQEIIARLAPPDLCATPPCRGLELGVSGSQVPDTGGDGTTDVGAAGNVGSTIDPERTARHDMHATPGDIADGLMNGTLVLALNLTDAEHEQSDGLFTFTRATIAAVNVLPRERWTYADADMPAPVRDSPVPHPSGTRRFRTRTVAA